MSSCSYFMATLAIVLAACTCGVRPECGPKAEISLLTSIHDDSACRKLSTKGVLLYEAAKFLTEIHNNKSIGYDLEVTTLDTCGSITGAIKASMKALVSADTNCLQPPYYLGIIGPDTVANAEAVQKITSVLKIPHIVRKSSESAYLHHLRGESDAYIIKGAMKVIQALKWKAFTLAVANTDDDTDDDIQNLAKKLTAAAIEKGLCVIIHDNDDDDFSSHIVHIGKPAEGFYKEINNSTILILSEGNLENHLNGINSTNTIVLLEDSRNDFEGLEEKVVGSKLWASAKSDSIKYDAEQLREVRWLGSAIEAYAKSLDALCKKKKCKSQINPVDWNNVVSEILSQEFSAEKSSNSMDILVKRKAADFNELGHVLIQNKNIKIHWKNQKEDKTNDNTTDDDDKDDDDSDENDVIPDAFKKLISHRKESLVGCATLSNKVKTITEDDDDERGSSHVIISEMDDSEWWTMVITGIGVVVSMFIIGVIAVYILYANIRGPVEPKNSINRDGSLRRVGSDREPPNVRNQRPQRPRRAPQREESVRSNISEKSV